MTARFILPKMVTQSPIVEHKLIDDMVWRMDFSAPEMVKQTLPGQFIHVRIPDNAQPFLRRPLSVCNIDKKTGTMSVIYRIVGDGTRRLSLLKKGDIVDCMGPLGTGFKLDAKKPLLIGGGMGIAPLVYLAEALAPNPVEIILGGRNKQELFWTDFFSKSCKQIHITTDDGSLGTKGFATDALPKILESGNFDAIYTCGPEPMMRGVAKIAKQHNISCQVSLEAHMACGVGACLSCTCETSGGKRAKICTDGPVFEASEVFI